MGYERSTPFETIEGAQEYLRLLCEELEQVIADVDRDRGTISASQPAQGRHLEALCLVRYKLQRLQQHIHASSRILNDLRMLRRLFFRDGSSAHQGNQGVCAAVQEGEHFGV